MEWVEVTAKSVESAKELALDRLGISAEDAEFDVVEEPRPGLFGRTRGEARVRARVRPAMVRQKQDRRSRRGSDQGDRATTSNAVSPDTRWCRQDGRSDRCGVADRHPGRPRSTPPALAWPAQPADQPWPTSSPPAAIPSKEG